jgi:hypothetical protein
LTTVSDWEPVKPSLRRHLRRRHLLRRHLLPRRLSIPRRRLWLWAAGAAVVAAFVAGALARGVGTSIPDGGPLAARQATAIDSLLDTSPVGRGYLLDAIDDVNACSVTISTMSNLRAAAGARQALLARVDAAMVTDLPRGTEIKEDLHEAVLASYRADNAYLHWVLGAGERCPTHADPAYRDVVAANAAADAAKRTLIDDWNPVATKYGLPDRSMTII